MTMERIITFAAVCSFAALDLFALDVPRRVLELPPSKVNARNSEGDFVRFKNGDILFAYSHFGKGLGDGDPADIRTRISHDGGLTWSERSELFVSGEGKNVMSVSFLRLKTDRVLLFYGLKKGTKPDRDTIMMRVSANEGTNWSAPRSILPGGFEHGYSVLNNSRAIQLSSGRIVLPLVRHIDPDGRQDFNGGQLYCLLSDDEGKTWRVNREPYRRTFDVKGRLVRTQEPGVVELKDGRILGYARTASGRQWFYYSSDGCETWSAGEPGTLFGPLSAATIKRLSTGDLVAVWNDHEPTPWLREMGPTQLYGLRAPLTLAVSSDEGRSWKLRHNLESDPRGCYCYFGLMETDGNLLLSYCAVGLEHQRVSVVPLKWLYEEMPLRAPWCSERSIYEGCPEGAFRKLPSAHGIWMADPDTAEVCRWKDFKGVKVAPGEAREITLTLRKPAKSKTLRLSAVRLGAGRMSVSAEAQTVEGVWKPVLSTDETFVPEKPKTLSFTSLTPSRVTAYRFRISSEDGVLLTARVERDFGIDSFFSPLAGHHDEKGKGVK